MFKLDLFVLFSVFTTVLCKVERPVGVAISKASQYPPGKDFTCFDGSKTVPFSHINDDYCDCSDASDEPGTSACPNGSFHCTNAGHRPMYIPSSRVNDGICDCCDGTDEYSREGSCQNTCRELGRAAREEAERQLVLMREGFEIYQQYAKDGFQAKQERQNKLAELEKEKTELEAKTKELEDLKNNVEEPERLAKEVHKKAWEEEKKKRELENEKDASSKAFAELDANEDSYLSVEEMKAHPEFDIDTNGDVTEEEAKVVKANVGSSAKLRLKANKERQAQKEQRLDIIDALEYLEDNDQVDLEKFQTEIWPNIKEIYKSPSPEHIAREVEADERAGEEQEEEQEEHTEEKEPEPYDDLDDDYYDDEYEEEEEEDDDDEYYDDDDEEDIPRGDGRRDDSSDDDLSEMPEYDEQTRQLIAEADKARQAYEEADGKFRAVERELNDIKKFLSLDLGEENEFFPLKDNCYEFTDREYTYKLCPFEKATQRSKTGGGETSLGKWGKWDGPEDNKYSVMLFENGQGCWNGPNRSVKVHIKCGVNNELIGASEPNRCEYEFRFSSPAACSSATPLPKPDPDHDEL